jgi:hypothetical protein
MFVWARQNLHHVDSMGLPTVSTIRFVNQMLTDSFSLICSSDRNDRAEVPFPVDLGALGGHRPGPCRDRWSPRNMSEPVADKILIDHLSLHPLQVDREDS